MAHDLSTVMRAISDELAALQGRREALVTEVSAIDTKIERIAAQLGIEASSIGGPSLPRLNHKSPRLSAGGQANSLPSTMMDILREADRGYSRPELKELLKKSAVGATVEKNENTFYNAIRRYIKLEKIVDIDHLLYHSDRAPLSEDEHDDAVGHLPENVTLFSKNKAATDR